VVGPQADDERRPLVRDRRNTIGNTTWSRPEGRDHEDAEAKQQRREQARTPEMRAENLSAAPSRA
jgi:hypothetical protein